MSPIVDVCGLFFRSRCDNRAPVVMGTGEEGGGGGGGGGVRLSRGKGQSLREKSVMGKIGGGEVGFNGPHTQLAADTQGRGDGGK